VGQQTGSGLLNGFIDHLYTRLWTTSNYSPIAYLHTLQITTAPAKPFPTCCAFMSNSWQRLLTVEILQLPALRSFLSSEYPVVERTQFRSAESESYVRTDGQSASLSWNKAPIWGLGPDFYYCQTVAGLLMWSALSEERTGLSITIAAGPRQRSHSRVRVPWDSRLPSSSPRRTLGLGS
jgi:hypothetical protein